MNVNVSFIFLFEIGTKIKAITKSVKDLDMFRINCKQYFLDHRRDKIININP